MQYLNLYKSVNSNEWTFDGIYDTKMTLKQWAKVYDGQTRVEEIAIMDGTDVTPIIELYKRSKGQEVSIPDIMKIPGTVWLKGNRLFTKTGVME